MMILLVYWHGLWMSNKGYGEIYNFIAVDEKYVYAYSRPASKVVYAEKPEWL